MAGLTDGWRRWQGRWFWRPRVILQFRSMDLPVAALKNHSEFPVGRFIPDIRQLLVVYVSEAINGQLNGVTAENAFFCIGKSDAR